MVEKILNNTNPYGKIRASREGWLHSSTLIRVLHAIRGCLAAGASNIKWMRALSVWVFLL